MGFAPRRRAASGTAHNSVVPHIGGSSSGAVRKRAERSAAAVYLGNRNKLHFVRQHHPGWFAWTVFVSFLRTGEYLAAGSTRNFAAAIKGLIAGLRGEKGRPRGGGERGVGLSPKCASPLSSASAAPR